MRGAIKSGNVALASNGTKVTGPPHNADAIVDGKTVAGDGNTFAMGKWPCDWYITFDKVYRLREIRLHLHDLNKEIYSQYTIETSIDGKYFTPLVDRSKGEWRSWQNVKFLRPVKAIKLTGLFTSNYRDFFVNELEAYCIPP